MSGVDEPQNPTADVVMDTTEAPLAPLSDVDDEGGLFGSGSEDERGRRKLDDEELDSGDDEDRNDRVEEDGIDGYEDQERTMVESQTNVLDLSLGRHGIPQGSDGELYLLKYPHNLGIDPKTFALKQFQPPSTDHHSMSAPSITFSPSQTANSTIRWRYGMKAPQSTQSNARILRWSDGSLTVQVASKPTDQYELVAKSVAPPQHDPPRPTPTSIAKGRSRGVNSAASYNPQLDSHTYLASPQEQSSFVRITNHITTSLSVKPSVIQEDDALLRLQDSLAAANKGHKATTNGKVGMIDTLEDPELAKKKAEIAEREKIRAQRRRQNQEERERDRANRVLGRSGLRTGGISSGLTVGGLEEEGATRARTNKASKRQRRRNSEYSDDEEDYRNRGRTKEDEYDEDDGFLVGSDEEPEVVQDASEEEEEMGSDQGKETTDKPKKSKAKGTSSGGRLKRRHVVEDEDED